jgi:hypothetical protein
MDFRGIFQAHIFYLQNLPLFIILIHRYKGISFTKLLGRFNEILWIFSQLCIIGRHIDCNEEWYSPQSHYIGNCTYVGSHAGTICFEAEKNNYGNLKCLIFRMYIFVYVCRYILSTVKSTRRVHNPCIGETFSN